MAECPATKLYLASASPRRAKLLRDAGIEFEQRSAPFDEASADTSMLSPEEAALMLATAKAESLAVTLGSDGIVIGCDTLLSVDGLEVGKPADADHARRILTSLMGRTHEVVTGVCLIDLATRRRRPFIDAATVRLGQLDAPQLDDYLAGGEWRGKAGGYNYAELAGRWPISVDGDPDTVIGLPVRRLKDELACLTHQTWDQPRRRQEYTGPAAVMSGDDRTFRGRLLRLATLLAEPFYLAAVNLRNHAYDMGWKRVHRAKLPVISVGNITAGGTGKTPMVMHVVRLLQRNGYRPAIILRGYRSTPGSGSDEQRLYEKHLPGVPVIVNPDRVAAAEHVAAQHPEVNVLVLDDAFQHRRIARDIDLVLLDASEPFGFGHVLPRGLLREPADNIDRADVVVLTHVEMVDYQAAADLDEGLAREVIEPAAWFAHAWTGLVNERDEPVAMARQRVLAFCGIGNPGAFFSEAAARFDVAETVAFADHHVYIAADVRQLQAAARRTGAAALLTTDKDWVKLREVIQSPPSPESSELPGAPVWRPRLELIAVRGGEALEQMLLERLKDAATVS